MSRMDAPMVALMSPYLPGQLWSAQRCSLAQHPEQDVIQGQPNQLTPNPSPTAWQPPEVELQSPAPRCCCRAGAAGRAEGYSLGQDAAALGLGEVLELQQVLGQESHGQVEVVVPKLQWGQSRGDTRGRGKAGDTPGPLALGWSSALTCSSKLSLLRNISVKVEANWLMVRRNSLWVMGSVALPIPVPQAGSNAATALVLPSGIPTDAMRCPATAPHSPGARKPTDGAASRARLSQGRARGVWSCPELDQGAGGVWRGLSEP